MISGHDARNGAGRFQAIMAEVFRGKINMDALLQGGVKAPLYRLPIANFRRALPKLIADGRLDGDEIDTLIEYENRIEELNRGLERAGDAHAAGFPGMANLEQEFQRNQAKAREILEGKIASVRQRERCSTRRRSPYFGSNVFTQVGGEN